MPEVNVATLGVVAHKLDALGLHYAFVGGAITALLLDNLTLSPVRPTDDVDIIVEILASQRYSDLEEKLRDAGLSHDTREGAPLCRWTWQGLTIDIMPIDGSFLGINTAWFPEALASATLRVYEGIELRIVSPVAFIATKLAAFVDRGSGDYYSSHDLEDLITVIDGRRAIVTEVRESPVALRDYVTTSIQEFYNDFYFREALPGHLPPDSASQARLPGLRQKIAGIAALANSSP